MLTTTQKKICMMSCIMEILAIINQNAISDKNSRKRLKSILNTRIVYSLVEQQKQYIIIKNLLIAKKEVWQTTARTRRKILFLQQWDYSCILERREHLAQRREKGHLGLGNSCIMFIWGMTIRLQKQAIASSRRTWNPS